MSNFESFTNQEIKPNQGIDNEVENKIDTEINKTKEEEDEFGIIEENEAESVSKSKSGGSKGRSLMAGVLGSLALFGAAKAEKSAEDMFTDKKMDKTEQMIKSEMENKENSQEASEFKFAIKKVKDLITDEQLDALVDSTGMVNTSELIYKIMQYHQELKAISYHKNKTDMGIAAVKFAKMHRIPGSVHIYVLENGQLAGSSSSESDTGKLETDLYRIGDVPMAFPKDEVKTVQLIFASK